MYNKGDNMKVEVCSNCGKVIKDKKTTCSACGANYCENCKKMSGSACLFCGSSRR